MTKQVKLAARYPESRRYNPIYPQISLFLNKGDMDGLASFIKRENLYLPVKSWQFNNRIIKIGEDFWMNLGSSGNRFGEIDYYSPIDLFFRNTPRSCLGDKAISQ